jgi:hypothetical protein
VGFAFTPYGASGSATITGYLIHCRAGGSCAPSLLDAKLPWQNNSPG